MLVGLGGTWVDRARGVYMYVYVYVCMPILRSFFLLTLAFLGWRAGADAWVFIPTV